MKKTLFTFIALCAIAFSLTAQTTTYYDKEGNRVARLKEANYYKTIIRTDTNRVTVKVYYKTGQLKAKVSYWHWINSTLNGKLKDWLTKLESRKDIYYLYGEMDGEAVTYWPNGKLKSKDAYKKGEFIKGQCFNDKGKIVPHVFNQKLPQFPGDSLFYFLARHIQYPPVYGCGGGQGRVVCAFVIEKNGNASSFTILKGLDKYFDQEAIRVLKSMPKWSPGLIAGEPVNMVFVIPVNFKFQ
jgi:protein TonB